MRQFPEPTFSGDGPTNNAVLYHQTDERIVIVYSQEQARAYLEHAGYRCRRPIEELPQTSSQDALEISGTAAGMIAEALRHTHDERDRSYATHTPRLVAFRPSRPGEQPESRNLLAITITSENDTVAEEVAIMFSLEQAGAYINARPWIGDDPHLGSICRKMISDSTLDGSSQRSPIVITGYATHEIITASMIMRRLLNS